MHPTRAAYSINHSSFLISFNCHTVLAEKIQKLVSKGKQTPSSDKMEKKPVQTAQGFAAGAFFRNGVIIFLLSIIFMGIYALNDKRVELPDLYNEMSTLQDRPGDHEQRMHEIGQRINEIETDTSYFKTLFVGYFDEVHFVAFGAQAQIDKVTSEIAKDGNAPLTREDKLSYKVHTFKLLDFINANCPANSVILLPPIDSFQNDSRWNYVYNPDWVEYFIYPRLCIASGKESENPELAKRITHVLIIKGIGYDKLKYDVPMDKREKIGLLPINKPAEDAATIDTTQTTN